MTVSRPIEVAPGIVWSVLSDEGAANKGCVVIPVEYIAQLSDEEIGRLVRSAVPSAKITYILNLAYNVIHASRHLKGARLLDTISQEDIDAMGDAMAADPKIATAYFLLGDAVNEVKVIEAKKERKKKVRTKMASNYNKIFIAVGRRDGFKCITCGYTGSNLQIDHIVPVSKGGTNDMGNLQLLCGPCNLLKSNK